MFKEALGTVWRHGTMYDNVLFFISHAVPYMFRARQSLSVVCPKNDSVHLCARSVYGQLPEIVFVNFIMRKVFHKVDSRSNTLE